MREVSCFNKNDDRRKALKSLNILMSWLILEGFLNYYHKSIVELSGYFREGNDKTFTIIMF